MSFFNHLFIIILCFLIVKASVYPILQKYGKAENTAGKVIFESKDFSEGDKMYFTIKVSGECRSDLEYGYYSSSEEPLISLLALYSVSSKVSSTTSVSGKVTSSTQYFTIEKKSKEYQPSNGNYLYLYINCKGNIDFENTEKDASSNLIILIVVVLVVFLVIIGIIVGVCCYCIRKRARIRQQALMNQPPMMIVGTPQPMYQLQGNMVIVQPNGIPYNNNIPNTQYIQYSNVPNNPPSGLTPQGNIPLQNYNMVPQTSSERGINSNVINEKVMK